MAMILSLDVDGVLADERRHLEETRQLWSSIRSSHREQLPEFIAYRHSLSGWWLMRPPAIVPTPGAVSRLLESLAGWDVQVISRRPRWLEGTTVSWLFLNFPWLEGIVKTVNCVGPEGSKIEGIAKPDLAIDDSPRQISEYVAHGVTVVGVDSHLAPAVVCRDLEVILAPDAYYAIRWGTKLAGTR